MSPLPRRPIIQLYQLASGRRIVAQLDQSNRTQWLDAGALLALQQSKLHRLLAHAYRYVPYYQRLFNENGFAPDDVLHDPGSIRRLPVLTKAVIRENFEALQTTERERRERLTEVTTSGSTGHPLVFKQDGNFRDSVTADIHRHLGWAGWRIGDSHCYIWGVHFEATKAEQLRTRLMNWSLNRWVVNSFTLSEDSLRQLVSDIRRRRPRIIFGYPASLCRFAQFVREHKMNDVRFSAIFSSAEMLYPDQRRFLEETFGGRVFNRYGTRELGGISCECDAHIGMHVSAENNYVEILKDGRPARPGEVGEVIVTNLNNFGMPFIRYSIEDLGAWSEHDSCPCGRELPMMDLMQGRRYDTLKTRDGRVVWGGIVGPLLHLKAVKQFQMIQKSFDLVVVRVVKDSEIPRRELEGVERSIKSALGNDVSVSFEFPNEIPVAESGKHRYTICEIEDSAMAAGAAEIAPAAPEVVAS